MVILSTEIDLQNVKRLVQADERFRHPALTLDACENRHNGTAMTVYLDGYRERRGCLSATRVGAVACVAALNGERLEMRDVIRIRPRIAGQAFAVSGDGGKLVRLAENGKIIGAVFASGSEPERFAYIIPIETLLAAQP